MQPDNPPPRPDPPPGHAVTVYPGTALSGRGILRAFLLWAAAAGLGGGAGWIAATTLGWLLATVLPGGFPSGPGFAWLAAGAAQGALTGLGLGVAQALALHRWLRRYARYAGALVTDWPWFSAGGGALGGAAGHLLGFGLAEGHPVGGALFAVGMGTGQWLTLRRFGPGFGWWVAASPVALAVGPALATWWLGPGLAAPVLLLTAVGGAGLVGTALLLRVWGRTRALEMETIMQPLSPICGFALRWMEQLRKERETGGPVAPPGSQPTPVEPSEPMNP